MWRGFRSFNLLRMRWLKGLVSWVLQGAAVGLYLLRVLFEGGGEAAVALGVGDEVEIVGVGWGERGFECGDAGIADRARRQPGMAVGVVWRRGLEVGFVDCAAITAFEQGGIDHAGVGSVSLAGCCTAFLGA